MENLDNLLFGWVMWTLEKVLQHTKMTEGLHFVMLVLLCVDLKYGRLSCWYILVYPTLFNSIQMFIKKCPIHLLKMNYWTLWLPLALEHVFFMSFYHVEPFISPCIWLQCYLLDICIAVQSFEMVFLASLLSQTICNETIFVQIVFCNILYNFFYFSMFRPRFWTELLWKLVLIVID
jgi:hypothetical protein